MSWRGETGGIEAAQSGHDVVMSPNTYLYFDYYQAKDASQEPLAIGGYLPLERVYSYEPMPAVLKPEEAKHILGVQANLWSEYFKTHRQTEYMALPRLAALAEIQWCQQGTRKYSEFLKRLPQLFALYGEKNYNFAKHYYDIMPNYTAIAGGGIRANLQVNEPNDAIYYTLDGTMPTQQSTRYTQPLDFKSDVKFRAVAFHEVAPNQYQRSHVEKEDFHFSKSTARNITLVNEPHASYKFDGAKTLVDGLVASNTSYNSSRWIGFLEKPMEAIIDLGENTTVSQVAFNVCVEKGDWIYDARHVEIAVSVDGGKTWNTIVSKDYAPLTQADKNGIKHHVYDFAPTTARLLKIVAQPETSIPSWHEEAAGKQAFFFVDEITVN